VLILHKHSGPHSVSDLCMEWLYKYLKLKNLCDMTSVTRVTCIVNKRFTGLVKMAISPAASFIMTSSAEFINRRFVMKNDRVQELCESQGGRLGLPVPNSPYDLCGRKAILKMRNVVCSRWYFT